MKLSVMIPSRGLRIAAMLGFAVMAICAYVAFCPGTTDPMRSMIPVYKYGVGAGLLSLIWSVWALLTLSKEGPVGRRWKLAAILICLGCASMVNSLVGMLALALMLNNPTVDFVVQTSGLFTYLAWPIALFAFPARRMLDKKKLPWILDVALIMTAISAAGWYFLIAPQVKFEGPRFAFWLTFAYPVADLVSLAGVVAAISLGGPFRPARALVMIGIAINVAGDVIQAVYMVHNQQPPMPFIQCLWISSALILGYAALQLRIDARKDPASLGQEGPLLKVTLARAVITLAFLGALITLALWGNWARPHSIDTIGLNIGCVVAAGCALVRLLNLIKDNNDLAKSLAHANVHLDEQVQERTRQLSQAKDEIERQERFLRSVIDAIPSLVVAKAVDGSIVLANEAVARFFSKSIEDLQGANYADIVGATNPSAPAIISEETEVLLNGNPVLVSEREIVGGDGTFRTFEVVKTPVQGASGQAEQVLIIGNDITVRKEAEKSLIVARDAAELSMKVKAEFLANMSHEIRTPMNGVLGFTDLLLAEDLSPEHRESAVSIKTSAESLLKIINDILDVSSLDSGTAKLEFTTTLLSALSVEVANAYRPAAEAKGIGIRLDVRLDPGIQFLADAGKLKKVLSNLVANAVKFTESGVVSIDVDLVRRAQDMASIRFSVTDTGIGIPAGRLGIIFDPFSQVDYSMTRKYGGTGLGLALCKQFTELMGGTIKAESREGEGSVFTLDLALKTVAEAVPEESTEQESLEGLQVLVVEDNEINQRIARKILERLGCNVTVANNGLEAVDYLIKKSCDVILMDCQMPVMDGLDATRRIREFESPGSDVPIIAVTANAMAGDREKCLAAGMDDYIAKPIKVDVLTSAMTRLTSGRAA